MKITEKSTLKEIIDIPGGHEVLKRNGVPCMTCPLGALEINSLTISHVSKIYGLNLEKILGDLKELKEIQDDKK